MALNHYKCLSNLCQNCSKQPVLVPLIVTRCGHDFWNMVYMSYWIQGHFKITWTDYHKIKQLFQKQSCLRGEFLSTINYRYLYS